MKEYLNHLFIQSKNQFKTILACSEAEIKGFLCFDRSCIQPIFGSFGSNKNNDYFLQGFQTLFSVRFLVVSVTVSQNFQLSKPLFIFGSVSDIRRSICAKDKTLEIFGQRSALLKSVTMAGVGVKNYRKLRDVIYGRAHT